MEQYKNIQKSRQKKRKKKIQEIPPYSGSVKALAIPPFGAGSSIALWRANNQPPLEVVVDYLGEAYEYISSIT